MELETLTEELKGWVKEHNIEERSLARFNVYIDTFRQDDPEEFALLYPDFSEESLRVEVTRVALVVDHKDPTMPEIMISLPISYKQKEIGSFKVFFLLQNGEYSTDVGTYEGFDFEDEYEMETIKP